jgi:hypothetical protein
MYANCVDQMSLRMFYAIAAGENLLVLGADVSNAFAKAPPTQVGVLYLPWQSLPWMVDAP